MPYSAVTQPRPEFRIHPGTPSVTLALHNTRVCPTSINTEPSAIATNPGVSRKTRAWAAALPPLRNNSSTSLMEAHSIDRRRCSLFVAISFDQGCFYQRWVPRGIFNIFKTSSSAVHDNHSTVVRIYPQLEFCPLLGLVVKTLYRKDLSRKRRISGPNSDRIVHAVSLHFSLVFSFSSSYENTHFGIQRDYQ